MQGPWVPSLVGELGSHMPPGKAQNKYVNKKQLLKKKLTGKVSAGTHTAEGELWLFCVKYRSPENRPESGDVVS